MSVASLRVGQSVWQELTDHIFQPDRDEHGGALLCGVAVDEAGKRRLLARRFVPATDGQDYIPGVRGYRQLTAKFIRHTILMAREDGLVCLLVHGHGVGERVAFSDTDLASHERGYPSLVDIAGQSVGALVLASHAVAGDIWNTDGTRDSLDITTVVGPNIISLTPEPLTNTLPARAEDDRQVRMLGTAGQRMLRQSRIGVVGAGGAGMLAIEMLARLGVGELVVIDPDKVELTNLNRLPGALRRDAAAAFTHPDRPKWIRQLGRRLSRYKVSLATRLARRAGQGTSVTTFNTNVTAPKAASALTGCDYILLAADSATARHLVNVIAHQYLIPVVQVGTKVNVHPTDGLGRVFSVVRPITPDSGCMSCAGLIDRTKLALEALPDQQRADADYGTGEHAPSVITLNGVAVSGALTHLMLAMTGLRLATHDDFVLHDARVGTTALTEPYRNPTCTVCGPAGVTGFGDLRPLPLPRK
ncbi:MULTISPECIES: ThiF family adenylyltransferase [unclassified Rhodococcus (in: high G+C Gram-positive bacteria)]|uniref:ThiF family adenylyltransferase n=1 Tax=unclassified Rhodococcus (in: high G+C Gram-positive bacteria) TaxID=192944 RepID=UPI000B9BAAA0|nr:MULTISPECIES: ThiF family adenylyltransferase [unclassified Rhodococcus (in: high G+C Gram-positive bacteria)]OZE40001.1 hypothetical protein CH259_04920 [Rhodococcus sp. 05-2254-4]OZE49569.1 hypothetical protein CH261_03355 [Rhodococcus sp. 05-2254-3]OZE50207.1 hypothetical protein CH283_10660 [Rhodococcus sp. 05-2254-2]